MKKMKKINNLTELRKEIYKLEADGIEKENAIKVDLEGLKDDLKPVNLLMSGVSSLIGNSYFNKSVPSGILSGIIQKVLLKSESRIEHEAYTILDVLLNKLNDLVQRFRSRKG